MTNGVHVPGIEIVCPVVEQERHLIRMLHQMWDVKVADVDLWYVKPLADECRVSPPVGHILASPGVSPVSQIDCKLSAHKRGLNTLM